MKAKFNLLCLLLFCIFSYTACKKVPDRKPGEKEVVPPHKDDEMVIWGGSPALRQSLLDSIRLITGNTDPVNIEKCLSCDGQLELWSGEAIKLFGSETVRGGSKSRVSASGTETVYYSLNFDIRFPFNKEALRSSDFKIPPFPIKSTNDKRITVAIFDSGLDPALSISREAATCIVEGQNGWNVVAGTDNIRDDVPSRHGTVVTGYVHVPYLTELDILPVKVLDNTGASSLFKFLCAIAFAANSDVDIINASLGFYYYDATPPYLLTDYIEEMLTKKGILLVTAAGNADPGADASALAFGIPSGELRNIDRHYFLPGSLSGKLKNIICVTTVNEPGGMLAVNNTQNYSVNNVTVGVLADSTISGAGYGMFLHPFENKYIDGSSFATPKMTREVALWLIKNGMFDAPFDRDDILQRMKNDGFLTTSSDLTGSIRNGLLLKPSLY